MTSVTPQSTKERNLMFSDNTNIKTPLSSLTLPVQMPVSIRDSSAPGKTVRKNGDVLVTIAHQNAKVLGLPSIRSQFRVDVTVPVNGLVPTHTLSAYLVVVRPVIGSVASTVALVNSIACDILQIANLNGGTVTALLAPLLNTASLVDGEL